jgi:hypothetical protein
MTAERAVNGPSTSLRAQRLVRRSSQSEGGSNPAFLVRRDGIAASLALLAMTAGRAVNSPSTSLRAERSNPLFLPLRGEMDCFVAALLAMTAEIARRPSLSFPAQAGNPVRCGLSVQSLTSRNTGSSAPSAQLRTGRTMTLEHDSTNRSRGITCPKFCKNASPTENQRAQGRPGARCTRGLMCGLH